MNTVLRPWHLLVLSLIGWLKFRLGPWRLSVSGEYENAPVVATGEAPQVSAPVPSQVHKGMTCGR